MDTQPDAAQWGELKGIVVALLALVGAVAAVVLDWHFRVIERLEQRLRDLEDKASEQRHGR